MTFSRRFISFLVLFCLRGVLHAESSPEAQRVGFEFALYFSPAPKTDPEKALKELLASEFPALRDSMTVSPKWSDLADYAPPAPDSFRYMTVDLKPEQGAAIAQSARVFILGFEAPSEGLLLANRNANTLALRLAELTDGLLWDEECRLLYSREAWRQRRVDSWQGNTPDVRGHVNMHAFRNPDLVRIITLGMRKFGLPDIVIAQTPSGESRAAGNTINAITQRLIEGQPFEAGEFHLVLSEIKHDLVRTDLLENALKGAKGRAILRLTKTEGEEGDPKNWLLAVEFPQAEGSSSLEKQASAFAALYGAEDEIINRAAGDLALKAASERARRDFMAKLPHFRKGLEPDERLMVKVPFVIESQTEYMWVEVTGWQGDKMDGVLMNDSYFDKELREGRRLTVALEDVYDYIHYKPDGTEEGNETSKVLKSGS